MDQLITKELKTTPTVSAEEIRRRFLAKISAPSDPNDCWIWKGAKDAADGYGRLVLQRRYLKAHRLSYIFHVGPIPDGLHVLHRCDNPACVNPKHLFVGTNADNMRDRNRKGRHNAPALDNNPNAKLTSAQVAEIRTARDRGEKMRVIAERFGVSTGCVHYIVHRINWRSLE